MLPRSGTFDLLDVGAGAGFVGEYLHVQFPTARYFFIEPIEALEERLVRRYGRERNLAGAASFGDVRFLTLLDVLEHQQDDRAFMHDLIDKMRPGAQLIITVPALRILWSDWDAILGHFRRYDRTALRRTVDGCPVEIKEVSYLFPELVPPGLIRRLLPHTAAGKESGKFPDVPAAVNGCFYWLGRCSMRLRRFMPFGSSLCMRIERL